MLVCGPYDGACERDCLRQFESEPRSIRQCTKVGQSQEPTFWQHNLAFSLHFTPIAHGTYLIALYYEALYCINEQLQVRLKQSELFH